MLFLGGSKPVTAYNQYVVEISDTGFNPEVCNISRDDEVVWKNVGTKVHRVIIPDAGVNSPPLFDTGDIEPGQVSPPAKFTYGGGNTLVDFYNPALRSTVSTGKAQAQAANCRPLPPTPTPTPTPIPATPTPKPQLPAGCRWVGCAVAVSLSNE